MQKSSSAQIVLFTLQIDRRLTDSTVGISQTGVLAEIAFLQIFDVQSTMHDLAVGVLMLMKPIRLNQWRIGVIESTPMNGRVMRHNACTT